jgi:hypothetical protein
MTVISQAQSAFDALGQANARFARQYPGDSPHRQPVHTVYGGAQLYKASTTERLGQLALASMHEYGADPFTFATGVGFVDASRLQNTDLPALQESFARDAEALRRTHPEVWLALTVFDRVKSKLKKEAVEDFRIDFEDGFGARPDAEEDAAAVAAAKELALAMSQGSAPPFIGIRVKSFGEEWKFRGARTLELFLDTLLAQTSGRLPPNFVVTLPKVTVKEQPETLVRLMELLEQRHQLPPMTLKMELMIELTQSLLGLSGVSPLGAFLEACAGRCVGAHLGTYDFTASCNITAAYQSMDHPMCDLAKGLMLLAYAGTGVFLSDGATNVMPVGPHRGTLTQAQRSENVRAVHSAWQLAHRHVRHSLKSGFYQDGICIPPNYRCATRRVTPFFWRDLLRPRNVCRTSWTKLLKQRWWGTCSMTRRLVRDCSTTFLGRSTVAPSTLRIRRPPV